MFHPFERQPMAWKHMGPLDVTRGSPNRAQVRGAERSRARAPQPAYGLEDLLVMGDLDDVAVRILQRADVAHWIGHVPRLPVQAPELPGPVGQRVDVLTPRHLDAQVRER